MISFLVGAANADIRSAIVSTAKKAAALRSGEMWEYICCKNASELENTVGKRACYDIACVDLSLKNGVDILKIIRRNNPSAYIIVLSDDKRPAVEYVRPDILTAGLLIENASPERLAFLLDMNLTYYIKLFYGDNSEKNFVLDNRDGRQLIPYNQISYFEACEKKIMLYTANEEYSFYDTLDSLEKKLPENFVRCHRSFIVSKDKISKIALSKGYMTLEQGEMIPVSRTYRSAVKELR